MKVILLFALFAVATKAQTTDGTDCPVNPNADDPNCLAKSVTKLGYLLPAIGKYVCAYNKLKEDGNVENYNAAAKIFIDVLKCVSCHLDKYLGDGKTLNDLLVSAGGTGVEALATGIEILKKLGIDELKAKLVCAAAGKLLQSQCLQDALKKTTPDILASLTDLYCKSKNSGAAGVASGLSEILGQAECALGEQIGLEGSETLEGALGSLSPELLQGLVGNILVLTGKVDLINKIVCLVINPLRGIVN
ncbi:ranaspumin-like [Lithobates pipiens]